MRLEGGPPRFYCIGAGRHRSRSWITTRPGALHQLPSGHRQAKGFLATARAGAAAKLDCGRERSSGSGAGRARQGRRHELRLVLISGGRSLPNDRTNRSACCEFAGTRESLCAIQPGPTWLGRRKPKGKHLPGIHACTLEQCRALANPEQGAANALVAPIQERAPLQGKSVR
jgi:hypothetical protein